MRDREERERELELLGASVRTSEPVARLVSASVRRRVRARRTAGAASVAAAVAVVAVGVSLVTGASSTAGPQEPSATTSVPVDPSGRPPCASITEGPLPPIENLAEQEVLVERALALDDPAFEVRQAVPTHLGVVVRVTGNLAVARAALPGVPYVDAWLGEEFGPDDEQMMLRALAPQLGAAATQVRRATKGLAGDAGLAYWQDAGALVVQWKTPVPAAVAALDGVQPGGVRVIVEPARYSTADLQAASRRVATAGLGPEVRISGISHCNDGSGLEVGVAPPLQDRDALTERLAATARVPVTVAESDFVAAGNYRPDDRSMSSLPR